MLQYSPRISWNSNEIKREGLLANNVLYYPDKFEIMHTTLFSISHIIVYNWRKNLDTDTCDFVLLDTKFAYPSYK